MPRSFLQLLFLALCGGSCCVLSCDVVTAADTDPAESPATTEQVSYYKDIRPIFQAHCEGCHQPAKRAGDFVMTSWDELLHPGESGDAAIVPGDPEASYLITQVTPDDDGEAAMPQGKDPLAESEIALIRKWIEQGAENDTPSHARNRYDADHPPQYTAPPVITALDYAPDGSALAVGGFHEVILWDGTLEHQRGRLIGLSERIEAVAFSPDGKRLAVSGGQPGRLGELQIWNVEDQSLEMSVPVTYDTIYGASWSPDGSLVAVGCGDSTVRAFNSDTGEQVFFNSVHDDWALDTVFSIDGELLLSVGRDMSTRLYNVPTQRFIDNVTSITPGALKGGISAVARHPEQNQILVGGSDGTPRIYRMERVTNRVIGDDANLIHRYPAMPGRIYSVVFSPDGKSIACGSSLDGKGQLDTYVSEFDMTMPEDIKAIVQKVAGSQSAEEQKRLEEYVSSGTQLLTQTELPTAIYALAYDPNGKTIAVAGGDGLVRLVNAEDGVVIREVLPVQLEEQTPQSGALAASVTHDTTESITADPELASETRIINIQAVPAEIQLSGPFDRAQLLVTGVTSGGEQIDLTRLVTLQMQGDAAVVSPLGSVMPQADGAAQLTVRFGEHQAQVDILTSGVAQPQPVSFVRDVAPVLARLGCNQGTCHGAKDGKNGFKLSLRGYDPVYDVRALTDDIRGRRTNVASPDDSLMLLKASGAVPHVGGQLTQPGEPYYEIIRRWIESGAKLETSVTRATSIEIQPENPVVQALGSRQQLRVIAKYDDGTQRDVTREAFLESSNTEVADVNRYGVVTSLRRGEAPILARYEGNYAATTLTAMGDRTGFVWQEPETWGDIDGLVAAKWERMKIQPSELCSDAEFLRRAYLDLTGLPPTRDQLLAFVQDSRPTQDKRNEVIDQLIGSEAYVEYWANKWADLLQVNSKFLGSEGATNFRAWIRSQIETNTPYDEFCYSILTASGSNKEHPEASYYKILREPDAMMENTTHLFLGVRFNCNKCHDHPFERWTQDQYYQTAAFFARVDLKRDPQNAEGNIGGTAVEGAKPLWEVVSDKAEGEVKHDRTGQVTAPLVPFDREIATGDAATRREELAKWIVSPENDYFARSYVNRLWGYLMGVGLIEPLDDIRAGNPPSNPELLDYLTAEFVNSGFNVPHLIGLICKSRAYQLDVATNPWNVDDTRNYSHAYLKRLPAEVLYDTVYTVTGSKMQIPGVPEGTRAAALPDVAIGLPDGFLDNLGRPVRESACECERSSGLQLGPVMALMNGPTVSSAISQPGNAIEELVASESDNEKLVNELFLRILNRPAHPDEVQATLGVMQSLDEQHAVLVQELKAYEESIAAQRAEQQQRWQAAIDSAQHELDAYQEQIRPDREKMEQERRQRITEAQAQVDQRLAANREEHEQWRADVLEDQTQWQPLEFTELGSQTGAVLTQEDDKAIFVTGANDKKGTYDLAAVPSVEGAITAIRLEALSDDRLPGKGPGRAPNGNFVVSEFSITAGAADQPDQATAVKLQNAKADFSQGGFDVATAIDGQAPEQSNGWATHPRMGENRVATFELAEPLTLAEGQVLRFSINQQYVDNMHTLGRFRISVTTSMSPVDFGAPQQIVQLLQQKPEEPTDEQRQALVDYQNSQDEELKGLQAKLAEAQKPLPEDPKLVQLQKNLEERKQPLPADPQRVRMQRAVELSQQQLANQRLTVAQDLAWALINTPAFLFNR